MLKTEIPYPSDNDTGRFFAPIAETPWSVWLDSGRGDSRFSRYDIIVADPCCTFVTRGAETVVTDAQGKVTSSNCDPFELLRSSMLKKAGGAVDGLPFSGGAVGYFAYDLARRFEVLPSVAVDDLGMPEMVVGIYEWALVCDREARRSWLVSSCYDDADSAKWKRLVEMFTRAADVPVQHSGMRACSPLQSNISQQQYTNAFTRIQHYLEAGDCYQVNFAQRFMLDVSGQAWSGYRQLRERSAGPFSAYLNTPFGQVMCTSPERFLQLRQGQVETRPIKGTRRRDPDPVSDRKLRESLLGSEKDRAENLMIVDLLRNDLGKSCKTGTVRVPELFSIESYTTVHHLVSSVTCHLADNSDALQLLHDCFPGGSITGAPKLRAMAIIDELEPHRRGLYCGSIGYIGFDGNMDTNIVIRTAIHIDGKLYYSAGGGIVRDSSCEAEYQESFDKAAAFISCFSQEVV